MNMNNKLFITLAFASVIALSACEAEGPAEKAGAKIDDAIEQTNDSIKESAEAIKKNVEIKDEVLGKKSESVGEYLDDSAITAKVKAEIMTNPLMITSKIDVITDKGVVKMSGVVNSQQSFDKAAEIASLVKGVKSVENNLLINAIETK